MNLDLDSENVGQMHAASIFFDSLASSASDAVRQHNLAVPGVEMGRAYSAPRVAVPSDAAAKGEPNVPTTTDLTGLGLTQEEVDEARAEELAKAKKAEQAKARRAKKKEEEAAAKLAAETPTTPEAEAATTTGQPITLTDLRPVVAEKAALNRPAVEKALKELGVEKTGQLKPEQFHLFMDALKKIVA